MRGKRHKIILLAEPHWRQRVFTDEALLVLKSAGAINDMDLSAIKDEQERNSIFDAELADASAVVTATWGRQCMPDFTTRRWDIARKLKVIAGTHDYRFEGWLNLQEAARRGVTVIDTSRSMTPTVAEYTFAMIFNLLRDIPDEIADVRRGGWPTSWTDHDRAVAGDLAGRRVGLAGFGVINQSIARFLAPFHCIVRAYDPFVKTGVMKDLGVSRAASLRDLAASSEIFIVGIPPTPATRQIISGEVLNDLPRGALFLLPTRMAVVDQEALWKKTRAGELRAAIDVFDPEPPPKDSTLRTDSNILPTPHRAGNTAQAYRRCFLDACKDAVAILRGKPARYAVSITEAGLYAGRTAPPTNHRTDC